MLEKLTMIEWPENGNMQYINLETYEDRESKVLMKSKIKWIIDK